jgi:hypothetical protein
VSPDFQSLVNAINRLTAAQQKGPLDYISLIVLILTLAALVYYTWETIKICRAAHRQNETAVMPMMWIRVEPPQSRLSNTPQVPSHLAFSLLGEAAKNQNDLHQRIQ